MQTSQSNLDVENLREKIFRYMLKCERINNSVRTRSLDKRFWTVQELNWKKTEKEALNNLASYLHLSTHVRDIVWQQVIARYEGIPVAKIISDPPQRARRRA